MAHLDADLAVTLDEDRPGMLAKALGCVSGAGINIDGYAEMNGMVHVLTTDLPATFSRPRLQLTTALPSTITVQHPHCPDGEQPSLGEVTSSSSRSAARRWGWSPRTVTDWPLTVNSTRPGGSLIFTFCQAHVSTA